MLPQCALKGKLQSLAGIPLLMAMWMCVSATNGEELVTMVGTALMLQWCADNLDTFIHVSNCLLSYYRCTTLFFITDAISTNLPVYFEVQSYLSGVQCNGSETGVIDCAANTVPVSDRKGTGKDAGVICQGQLLFACLPDIMDVPINTVLHSSLPREGGDLTLKCPTPRSNTRDGRGIIGDLMFLCNDH